MTITRDDDIGGTLLNCAVRYALGRNSYMPGLVIDEITPMLKDCSGKTLHCFYHDIQDFFEYDVPLKEKDPYWRFHLKDEWLGFQAAVKAEIDRRANKC